MLFTVAEWANVRSGHKHAHLALRSNSYSPQRLTKARRECVVHNEDGDPVGRRREAVIDSHSQRPVVLMVTQVDAIDIYGPGVTGMRSLTLEDVRACGFKTVNGAREAWKTWHPRSDFAQLVWFVLGDHRDRDIFLNWTGRVGGDYTRSPRRSSAPDAPALRPEQYEALGVLSRQKAARAKADAHRLRTSESLAQRTARLEALPRELRAVIRQEMRIVGARAPRWDREVGRQVQGTALVKKIA